MAAVKRRRRGAFLNAGAKAQSEIQAELDRAAQLCDKHLSVDDKTGLSSSYLIIKNNDDCKITTVTPSHNEQHNAASHHVTHVTCAPPSGPLTDHSVNLSPGPSSHHDINSEDSLRSRALHFLKILEVDHSSLFTIDRPPPLQRGIQKTLFSLYPSVPRKVIRYAIGLHTNRLSYLRSIRPGYSRYAIDMTPGPSVTEEEALAAKRIIIARKQKLQTADIDDSPSRLS